MSEHKRLHVVDALRGFAIVSIMLLHNIEHFDFYYLPENLPLWMVELDKSIWDSMFFLFGGKSYAIFALLFGLTFYIQQENMEKRGKDFRYRFAWRLVLLLVFGIINSAFYQGDILTIYAILGFSIIPVAKLSNKTVFWVALVFMLQPYELYNLCWGIQHPEVQLANPSSWAYFGKSSEYLPGNSFWETIQGNLTNGKTAVFLWVWEVGRVFQTIALFMLGMLAGRKALFEKTNFSRKFWSKTLIFAALAFSALYFSKNHISEWVQAMSIQRPLLTIVTSWSNMAFMLVLVSGFVLLFNTKRIGNLLKVFSSYGRMSLTNYIMQSIAGATIYYGFGLGLYKYTGATYCILIGIGLAILQGFFSAWWMKSHKQGPLESIWHKLTWLGQKKDK